MSDLPFIEGKTTSQNPRHQLIPIRNRPRARRSHDVTIQNRRQTLLLTPPTVERINNPRRRYWQPQEVHVMTESIVGHFDGKVLVPDGPVELPVGQPLHIRVELVKPSQSPFADLLQFATDVPDAPPDLSLQHDHYLYGTPKK
jgi:hypothetical protein